MKRLTSLILFQIILSAISAFLLSEMSFFGKVSISLFYKEYSILKNPPLTGAIIFGIQLLIIGILHLFYTKSSFTIKNIVAFILLMMAIAGLYFTYLDFTEEFSHRILKSKFHFGGYLFWIGIITTTLFYLFKRKTIKIEEKI